MPITINNEVNNKTFLYLKSTLSATAVLILCSVPSLPDFKSSSNDISNTLASSTNIEVSGTLLPVSHLEIILSVTNNLSANSC